jgi:hypothetical protein
LISSLTEEKFSCDGFFVSMPECVRHKSYQFYRKFTKLSKRNLAARRAFTKKITRCREKQLGKFFLSRLAKVCRVVYTP